MKSIESVFGNEIEPIFNSADHDKAMSKIVELVNVRERNEKELRDRLSKCGFSPEVIDGAIESAIDCYLFSDERFARAYIRGKISMGWGRQKILQRLKTCGISDDVIELCSDEFVDDDLEYQMAMKALSKRVSTSKDQYGSYMRRLIGKGFSYDISSRAVRDFLAAQNQS